MLDRRVFYAEANYGQEEIDAVIDVLKNQRHTLVNGKNVIEFENRIAQIYGKKFGLMVNSGSSANLLAILSCQFPNGSEIVTPSLTFSTTVAPIVQAGLVPVFVDCDINTLQIRPDLVASAITDKTVAILVPNLIGNVADWDALAGICKERAILLIEDSADTIGYEIHGETQNTNSSIVTTSFYASHIITGAGTGGMVCFNEEDHYNKAKSLRNWGRRSSQYGETEDISRRLSSKIEDMDYDDKYVFDDLGYNFAPSEISAAFALKQLEKLGKNISIRDNNFSLYVDFFGQHKEKFNIFGSYKYVKANWLAFPVCLTGSLDGKRRQFQEYLENRGVQTRTIFTGNVMKHPCLSGVDYRASGSDFSVSDLIMKNGVLLGCHNGLIAEDIQYVVQVIEDFIALQN